MAQCSPGRACERGRRCHPGMGRRPLFLLRGELSGRPPQTPTPPPEWGRGTPAPREAGSHVFTKRVARRRAQSTSQGVSGPCSGSPCLLPVQTPAPQNGQGAGARQVPPLCPPGAASPGPEACHPTPRGAAPAAASPARKWPWGQRPAAGRAAGALGVPRDLQDSCFPHYCLLVSYHLTLVFTYIGGR